ncbi:MAG TPA: hypothetical protein VFL57_15965 [Bryobacteraceae bacterium]|nr:hypothetical protein [Bryobacteraceae bacterium]
MRVLGYDARVPRTLLANEWDAARRQQFLLRPDAAVPLSVDTMVWPSLIIRGGSLPEVVEPNYETSLAARPEEVRAAVRGRKAEIVAITEGDDPLPGEEWVLLGWDIADGYTLSGISNCGVSPEEWRPIRQRWASEVNDNNLFSDYGAADECRNDIDQLVPEHAPFAVYGLWVWEP